MRSSEGETFLRTVLATSRARRVTLKADQVFWRAQLGHDWREEGEEGDTFEVPCAHPPKRMKPLADRASDGRANPRGIPCLYLASLKETAVHEVRPWIGSYVSVAQFKLLRDVRVVDCTGPQSCRFYLDEPPPEQINEAVWADIDHAFADP